MRHKYFLDTSALAKLYVREEGTESMLELTKLAPVRSLAALSLSRVELHSAVRRRARGNTLDARAVEDVLRRFEDHWGTYFLIQPVTEFVLSRAIEVVDRHALRAYDALQLAGCMTLRDADPTWAGFICSDLELLAAAEQEGVPTINPESQEPGIDK